jgi:hypothetical protein
MRSNDRTMLTKLGFSDPDRKNERHDAICSYVCDRAQAMADVIAKPEVITEDISGVAYVADGYDGRAIKDTPRGSVTMEAARLERKADLMDVRSEHHLTKGEGKYKTTVGFVDAFFTFQVQSTISGLARIDMPNKALYRIGCESDSSLFLGTKTSMGKVHIETGRESRTFWEPVHKKAKELSTSKYEARGEEAESFLTGTSTTAFNVDYMFARSNEMIMDAESYDYGIRHCFEVKAGHVPTSDAIRQVLLYREFMPATWFLVTGYKVSAMDLEELARADIRHLYAGERFEEWYAKKKEEKAPAMVEI